LSSLIYLTYCIWFNMLNKMQNQIHKNDSSSEEIYQEMTRDAFGISSQKILFESEKFDKSDATEKFDYFKDSKNEIFKQKLVNTITAELQGFIPGAFQILPQSEQCLSYANLHSWSPGRAYFSLFEMKKSKSIWILHFSRSVGEGLAYLVHKENFGTGINIYDELREADSLIYLEIGEILRKLFSSLIKLWPKIQNLNVSRCRHILQLGFQTGVCLKEEYIIFPFHLKNKECSGDFNLIFPSKYIF